MRPVGIRRNHQDEPASDAGERKKEKSGGAVGLRRLVCQGRGWIQWITCSGAGILCQTYGQLSKRFANFMRE